MENVYLCFSKSILILELRHLVGGNILLSKYIKYCQGNKYFLFYKHQWNIKWREYYMASWRYQISLEEKFLISEWPYNNLYLLTKFEVHTVSYEPSFIAQVFLMAQVQKTCGP